MAKMILVMVDECGEEVEVEQFEIGADLDEDYLQIWKDMKIQKAYESYPEARNFYFEDRRGWNSAINRMIADPTLDFEDAMCCEDEEDEWDEDDYGYESNCHCDSYGICGGTSCPNYYSCQGGR